MAPTTLTSDVSLDSSQGNVLTPHGSRSDGRFGAHVSHVRSSSIVEPGKEPFRNLGGATVLFQDGAAVKSVALPSDYSTIQLSGLAPTTNIGQIIAFVTDLGFHGVDESYVRLKPSLNSMDQIAEVKVKDPTFAQQFIQRAGTNLEIQGKTATAAHIQRLDSDAGSEPSAKRLQLNSVLCSWYNPSRIVWLHFGSEKAAVKAVEFLNGLRKLRGRKLQTKYQPPPIHAYWSSQPVIHSVQVGNLDVETTQEDLRRFLRGREPGNIKMGPKSYMATPQEASLQVKDSLEAFGQLTDWDVSAEAPGTRSKAIARFANPEDARRASAGLNGKKTSALEDTKLFVNTVTSIKFSILSIILNAVRVQLEEIKARVWELTPLPVVIPTTDPNGHDPRPRYLPMFGHLKTMAIFIDGTYSDNGTLAIDSRIPRGGFAFIFKLGNAAVVSGTLEQRGQEGTEHPHTSNRTELRAVITALRFRFWYGEDWERVVLITDSEYVGTHATARLRKWAERGWRTRSGQPVKNQDLWKVLSDRIGEMTRHGCEVCFWVVPRRWNTLADAVAKAAINKSQHTEYSDIKGVLV
ncbi:hypothetical protein BFW01_g456 [Lasiodiplodia theobromae]|nr:hypothetical protein BFW01_g456 [Lasiodiplodia theobromae]